MSKIVRPYDHAILRRIRNVLLFTLCFWFPACQKSKKRSDLVEVKQRSIREEKLHGYLFQGLPQIQREYTFAIACLESISDAQNQQEQHNIIERSTLTISTHSRASTNNQYMSALWHLGAGEVRAPMPHGVLIMNSDAYVESLRVETSLSAQKLSQLKKVLLNLLYQKPGKSVVEVQEKTPFGTAKTRYDYLGKPNIRRDLLWYATVEIYPNELLHEEEQVSHGEDRFEFNTQGVLHFGRFNENILLLHRGSRFVRAELSRKCSVQLKSERTSDHSLDSKWSVPLQAPIATLHKESKKLITFDSSILLQLIRSLSTERRPIEQIEWYPSAVGWLEQNELVIKELVSLFFDPDLGFSSRSIIIDLLASQRSKAAHDAILLIIKSEYAQRISEYSLLIQRLSMIEKPSDGLIDFVETEFRVRHSLTDLSAKAKERKVASTMLLGKLIGKLKEDKRAKEFMTLLLRVFAQAESIDKPHFILALGHSGLLAEGFLISQSSHDDERIRRASMQSLYELKSPKSIERLVEICSTGVFSDQQKALDLLLLLKLEQSHYVKIGQAIAKGQIPSELYERIIKLLSRIWLPFSTIQQAYRQMSRDTLNDERLRSLLNRFEEEGKVFSFPE